MWLGWPSSVVEKFINHEADFEVNTEQLSWIVAIMDLGNVISPLIAGYLMDRIGRKLSIVILGPLFMVTWLLTLFIPTTWALYTARLLAGMGKGMSYTVVPVFLGEIAGVNIRGSLSSVFCFQLHAGFLLEAVVGPLVSYRMLNTISAVFPVLFILTVIWIPESPYYMLRNNCRYEAAKCLRWFRSGSDGELNAELEQMEISVKKEMENRATFQELFTSRKDLSALMVVIVACISQRAGGISCILAYSSLILPSPSPIMDKHKYMMLFAILMVVINFFGAVLVEKVGRKPLLVFSEAAMGVITLVFAIYFYLSTIMDVSWLTWLPYLCHVLFSVAFAIGVGFIPVVFLGEMFPVNIRSHCSAIASITLASCSFATNKMFLFVSRYYGLHVMFCLFTVVNFTSVIFSYKYAVETKGKTFLEIQELLEKTVKCQKKIDSPKVNKI